MQPPYGLFYSLGLIELKTLKTYIETHLKIGYIQPFKSPASILIFFNQKPDKNFHFCVHYQGLNNLTIKNRYTLSLVGKALDRLGWAKCFI